MKTSYSMFPGQSNVASGKKILPTTESFVGMEGRLCKVSNVGGVLTASLVDAVDDSVYGVIGEGKEDKATIFFPNPQDTFRLKLAGTCNPVDGLKPQAEATVGTAGAGEVWCQAEEVGVAGQMVLVRKL